MKKLRHRESKELVKCHMSQKRHKLKKQTKIQLYCTNLQNISLGISHYCCCTQSPSHVQLCDPINCSTPGFTVLYHLLKFAQVHVHCIDDATEPSHPLMTSSPSTLNLSQLQGLFQWVICSHQMDVNTGISALASVLPVNIQGWSPWRLTGLISLLSKGLSGVFSSTTVWKHQFFGILPSLPSNSHNCMWPLGRP